MGPTVILQPFGWRYVYLHRDICQHVYCRQCGWQWGTHCLTFMWQWGTHCCLQLIFPFSLVLGKTVLKPASMMLLLSELVVQVVDLPPIVGDLIVLDIAKVASNVKLLSEGFANIPVDVIHSGGPRMVQLFFEPSGVSTKLTRAGTDKQVLQISGTPVALCSWH